VSFFEQAETDGHPNRSPQSDVELFPITLWGQPVLHRPASPVTTFDDALVTLIERMTATMRAAPGAGLAGPQVGLGLRLFTYDCGPGKRGHVINPVLTRIGSNLEVDVEGCLSLPALRFPTPRAVHVKVDGFDADGTPITVEGEGYLARCFQHEVDHLDGTLYVERLGGRLRKDAQKAIKAASWYGKDELEAHLTG
jgi:peptide deformylase